MGDTAREAMREAIALLDEACSFAYWEWDKPSDEQAYALHSKIRAFLARVRGDDPAVAAATGGDE